MKFYNKLPFHIAVIIFSIVSDQLTKQWALARFTNETGAPNHEVINVIGELARFQLVFNKGAAFSSRPQDLMPFLPPWLFFLLISVVAAVVLFWFYRSIDKRDYLSRLGVVMIIGGAIGNFIDRMRLQMVVDFIDCDFPDFIMTRFPTFNVADSFVTVGVALVILSPVILRKLHKQIKEEEKAAKEAKATKAE
ncbi:MULTISPECIES: signal peptidase II [unclassified Fibrobacter]|uniref:signal peptidase II n=1 Tax=unclassified Fibrobacter TaxID=2634177 RepID=UPI000913A30A|nr:MULTISPECIES: signal peptidase II [unclassified Fibrobacter]OWV15039.1 signal peptidase II [Fibrobacter sp. UWH1]SHL40194.1 signal peptidase II [Fibrobacter sp. UWH5]